jgi:hypothetical protein
MANDSIPPIFLSMAFSALVAAACLWVFSGHGNRLFEIDATGINRAGFFGAASYRWADFELLERQVATIILHLKPSARTRLGPSKIAFDLAGIDCTGPRLEALIVHYRPDLYNTLHVVRAGSASEREKAAKPAAAEEAPVNPLSERISRLR